MAASRWFPARALTVALALAGCAAPREQIDAANGYPLQSCVSVQQRNCSVQLVTDSDAVTQRDTRFFPSHYLELWDPKVREAQCLSLVKWTHETQNACEVRLAALDDYFNPGGPVSEHAVGVALEGGGSKTAQFALGVLAGLNQAGFLGDSHASRVGAISSVSGGSYAASYLFNRLYDKYKYARAQDDYSYWFASCVPSIYAKAGRPLGSLKEAPALRDGVAALPECGECDKANDGDHLCTGSFHDNYSFMDQVWSNPDLLFPDGDRLRQVSARPGHEIVITAAMFVPTLATVPLQFVGRTVFRFPFNVSPTKWIYRYGLERQFGFSPVDWKDALQSREGVDEVLNKRNQERTLAALGNLLAGKNAPTWIVNSSSPGGINAFDWFLVRPRDPVRLQFELTPTGYGSGFYGYAKRPPESPMRMDTLNSSTPLSMGDATLVSAAFADSEQVRYNGVERLPFGLLAHGLNFEWFSEVRNFNVAPTKRLLQESLPWPIWGVTQTVDRETPYIHLHDGGNSENSGILPLLRRGYRTIVYSHGTDDRYARFEAICHVKNQLELDGVYEVRSPDLEEVLKKLDIKPLRVPRVPPAYSSYLDELCTREMTETISDQMTFGVPDATGNSKLSRLVCERLGYTNDPGRLPCAEYFTLFPRLYDERQEWPHDSDAKRAKALVDLFFQWPDTTLRVVVCRTSEPDATRCSAEKALSTIYVALPAISFKALAKQVDTGNIKHPASWEDYCAFSEKDRSAMKVNACRGPDDKYYMRTGHVATNDATDLPCIALAHILLNACKSETEAVDRRPQFPQHNFISQTWNSSYTQFAAYFDLGRDWSVRISRAICGNEAKARPARMPHPACDRLLKSVH